MIPGWFVCLVLVVCFFMIIADYSDWKRKCKEEERRELGELWRLENERNRKEWERTH
jgi:hypothetical protein